MLPISAFERFCSPGRSRSREASRGARLAIVAGAIAIAAAGCAIDPDDSPAGEAPSEDTRPADDITAVGRLGGTTQCGRTPPCCPGFEERDGFCFLVIDTQSQDLHPTYYVLALVYAPPGKGSSVAYQDGSGIAHRVDLSNSVKASVGFSVAIPGGGGGGASFSATTVQGHSYQIKNNAVSMLSVSASGRANDEIPIDDDIFYIAFSPRVRISRTQVGNNPPSATVYAPDFNNVPYIGVTTGALKNPALMDPYTKSLFVNFTSADYQQILKLDPRAIGQEVGDPTRYTYVRTMALQGPLPPLYDNRTTETQTYTRDTSNDNTSGRSWEIKVKTESDAIGVLKTQTEISFAYTNTVTDTTSTSRSATVSLSTTTHDCSANYDVYYDSLFNTLAFKKLGSAPACQ